VVGIQAQVEGPALLALSMRTAGRPTAAALKQSLLESPRQLVRIWSQRDTLHAWDPADWPLVAAADRQWEVSGRRGDMPPEEVVKAARRQLGAAGGPLTRSDLFPLLPDSWVATLEERTGSTAAARRFAAGRLVWILSHAGEVAVAGRVGREQAYVARDAWLPELAWPELEPEAAAAELTRRYLAVNGPASVQDVAHFFGARVPRARAWLAALEPELTVVRCEGRELRALSADTETLCEPPGDWPVRLLAGFDTLLMAHADKSWTVPATAERPLVWRRMAQVSAVVLARGRVVGTWTHATRRRRLVVSVRPLSGWTDAWAPGVEREAQSVAAHLGKVGADVEVGTAA